MIEELPTAVRAVLAQAEVVGNEERDSLMENGLTSTEKRIYVLLSAEEARHIDDLVENSGLNFSDVLANLFSLEMKGIVR